MADSFTELRTKNHHLVAKLYEPQGILEFSAKGNPVRIHYPPGTPVAYRREVKPYGDKNMSVPVRNRVGQKLALLYPSSWTFEVARKGEYLRILFPVGTKLTPEVMVPDKP